MNPYSSMTVPRSYSVAPSPRPTERSMIQLEWSMRNREFDSEEEINDFVQSEEGQDAVEETEPESQWEKAQAVAYDAWETVGPLRYELAREALAIDERCSDAWLILAEEERAWRKQKRCFERAVAAAERLSEDEGLLADIPEAGGSLYGTIPGRTVMRASVALARCLMEGGYHKESLELHEKLLRLDPDDHMGLRSQATALYHRLNDREGLRRLVDQFADDALAEMPYERLWLAIAEGAADSEIERLEKAAFEANPYVFGILLGKREVPEVGEYITVGGEDDAASYLMEAAEWWLGNPNTLAWLQQRL